MCSSKLELDIDIISNDPLWLPKLSILEDLIFSISQSCFKTLALDKILSHIEFSVTLTNDNEIQSLNSQYRNKDKATNVLSFPADEIDPNNPNSIVHYNGYILIGDIVISFNTVQKEAELENKTFENHFAHLFLHGLLHLLGYDHEEEREAIIMEDLERKILLNFNIQLGE